MKKSRAPRTPYIPPAARAGTSSGSSKGSILDTRYQDDSTKHESGAVGSGGTGNTDVGRNRDQRKARNQDCTYQRSDLASTASNTATSTATTTNSPTTAVVVAVGDKDKDPNDSANGNICDSSAFSRQCSVESCDDEKSSSAHQEEVALIFEVEGASKGQSRRKAPRKAWSQYVPPGRRAVEGDNKAPLKPVMQSSRGSAPSSHPALTTTAAERLPKGALSPATDASDAQDGLEETRNPAGEHAEGEEHDGMGVKSTVAVQTATAATPDCTARSMAHEGLHGAAKDNASPEIEVIKHPAKEPRALCALREDCSDAQPSLHAPSSMVSGACASSSSTPDAIVAGARSGRPTQAADEPGTAELVPETGIAKPPTKFCSEGMTSDREQHPVETSAGPSVVTDTTEADASRPNNPGDGHDVAAETDSSTTKSRDSTAAGEGETQSKPMAKTTFERYVPPGRRKLIEEAVAAGDCGTDGATPGMGPLWTSRAPVRVSQRARASDGEASPQRPAPARLAGAVSGGMSAYGANISEYSEHMSRDQVERCTAYIRNFPSALPPGQREPMLQSFVALGALIVWPRPDEALATFATPALARQAVSSKANRSSVLVVELLSEAREEKRAALKRVELARPGRPPADISSATRLISGALGIRRPRAKPTASPIRQSAATTSSGTVRIRGRGAKTAQQQKQQPAESTDSWDL